MSASPAVYEALAKSIVFLNQKPNAQNEVSRFLETNAYYIDRIFDDPETGFYAIGFGSSDPQNRQSSYSEVQISSTAKLYFPTPGTLVYPNLKRTKITSKTG